MKSLASINPATGASIREYPIHTDAEVEATLALTHRASRAWAQRSLDARCQVLRRCAGLLEERSRALAEVMADEMGKPICDGIAEAEKCAWVCNYYAEHAAEFLARTDVDAQGGRSYVAYRPLGIVLAVMPWNYPLWQVFRAAAPSLALGNGVVLKHASNVTGCGLAIEALLRDAGVDGAFAFLKIDSSSVKRVIEDDRIAAVTVTGSVGAGRAVAKLAGGALKKCVLELGGADPYLVLEDADVELAAKACAQGRLVNNGQSCIAAKRMIVHRSIVGPFTEALVSEFESRRVGDPRSEDTQLGPMARVDLRDELAGLVRASTALGARTVCGGEVPDREGAWFPPTVLDGVDATMAVAREETFGPVAPIMTVDGEDEAVMLANGSPFGLASAVFSSNIERAETLGRERLEAGACFINRAASSDPRLPFGGIKDSGFGRELGIWGIREFANTKAVVVD
ncbi:MAG: NAD-dependent succinate-semialdehyde dehydrogenase [Nannocystaceae bacterium]|nr:NAD-dependent succinate-semialdehyde dehydrogenase [bacterium]